jgi:hypothetical protein
MAALGTAHTKGQLVGNQNASIEAVMGLLSGMAYGLVNPLVGHPFNLVQTRMQADAAYRGAHPPRQRAMSAQHNKTAATARLSWSLRTTSSECVRERARARLSDLVYEPPGTFAYVFCACVTRAAACATSFLPPLARAPRPWMQARAPS